MFIFPAGYALSAYTPPLLGAILPPAGILAERVDPTTGELTSLLPGERPNAAAACSLHASDDPTDAAILWQFRIRQGQGAANGTNGTRLHAIRKATEQAPGQIADEGRRVLAKFEGRGQVSNVAAAGATPGGSTAIAALEVSYDNASTGARARVGGV